MEFYKKSTFWTIIIWIIFIVIALIIFIKQIIILFIPILLDWKYFITIIISIVSTFFWIYKYFELKELINENARLKDDFYEKDKIITTIKSHVHRTETVLSIISKTDDISTVKISLESLNSTWDISKIQKQLDEAWEFFKS